jgi:diphthamide biosynthesis protein 3
MADDEQLSIYDEIEIEDMTFDPNLQIYHYPCPCGDRFEIGIADLRDGEEIAVCPSCSLMIRVIFDPVNIIRLLYVVFLKACVLIWGSFLQNDLPMEEEQEKQEQKAPSQVPVQA